MKKISFVLLLLHCLSAATAQQPYSKAVSEQIARVETSLSGEDRKVTTNTLFEPGSISKSLNAVGILQLAQQGKVDLYQDINQYLVNWKFPYDTVSHGKKIQKMSMQI